MSETMQQSETTPHPTIHREIPDAGGVADVPLPPKYELFGVPVSATHYGEVVDTCIALAKAGKGGTVQFMSAHGLVLSSHDAKFKQAASDFTITCTDGMPVRWAMNRFHDAELPDRVYGPETTWRLLEAAEREGVSVYFWGGTDETLAQLLGKVKASFPELEIAGSEAPPFRPLSDEEHDEVARRVNDSGAGLMFVGIGCPKQEYFCDRHKTDIDAVMLAVGAAFDFHAGAKRQAPKFMQDRGLEWLFRLATEPRRLWRRYLGTNSRFLLLWAKREMSGKKGKTNKGVAPAGVG